jgi:hypothetical protein
MRTTNEMLDDWVNHHITNEPTARAVVEILRKRWGWTILIEDIKRFEEQANEAV